jgi:hypothetical protein
MTCDVDTLTRFSALRRSAREKLPNAAGILAIFCGATFSAGPDDCQSRSLTA